jgi:dolichol-phosphate mannosyltransferase
MRDIIELAIIIPVFNEAKAFDKHFKIIYDTLRQFDSDVHFVIVDDGSIDGTWSMLQGIVKEYENVKAIRFSRNFGKELAIFAGLESIDAQKYVIMDSDLQHPPKYIKDMLEVMKTENADIVEGVKESRGKESYVYTGVAASFYRLLESLTGLKLKNSSDFKIINSRVVSALCAIKEKSLFFRGLVDWVGFKKVEFPFVVDAREDGTSRFTVRTLIRLAFTAILSHTSKPLYLTIMASGIMFVLAFILGIQTLYNYVLGHAIGGFTTVIILILFSSSMVMFSLGIIGFYISRIYDEVKGRPRYIIAESHLRNEVANE